MYTGVICTVVLWLSMTLFKLFFLFFHSLLLFLEPKWVAPHGRKLWLSDAFSVPFYTLIKLWCTHTHTHKDCRLLKPFPLLGVLRESFKTKRSYGESGCILKQFAVAIQSQAHLFLLRFILLCSADTVFYKL